MEEEKNTEIEPNEAQKYIDSINDLKKNTVPREDFIRLQEENKTLIENLSKSMPPKEEPVEILATDKDVQNLRNEIFNEDFMEKSNDLQKMEKYLALRKAVLDTTGDDIFVGKGHKFTPDSSDYERAAQIADIYQQCVDYAQGDSNLFIQELQRRTVDANIPRR